jgi:hypothetical protein
MEPCHPEALFMNAFDFSLTGQKWAGHGAILEFVEDLGGS